MKFLNAESYNSIFKDSIENVFGRANFAELNAHKADDLFYLSNEEKHGIIFGLRNGYLLNPFSSPYAGFASTSGKINIQEFLDKIIIWARSMNLKGIVISLPPLIQLQADAQEIDEILKKSFEVRFNDTLQYFDLSLFDSDNIFPGTLKNAIKNYNRALSENLSFRKLNSESEITEAYKINKENRLLNNRPMNMPLADIQRHESIFPIDFFGVFNDSNEMIASSIVFNITDKVSLVQYWAHLKDFQHLRPMNYLAVKLCDFYKKKGLDILDLGISSYKGELNEGLYKFKKSIGALEVQKITYQRTFNTQ